MIDNQKINQRLKSLQFNIEAVNDCYNDTLRDTITECGLEYNKRYPYYDEDVNERLKRADELEKLREDKLFSSILNFTQAYYSIKEYLRKEYPSKHKIIEDFFSNDKIRLIARKDICNDLKHNPEKDLKYGLGQVSKEIIIEEKSIIEKRTLRKSWFYSGIDSVEYCNTLFKDLLDFIEKHFDKFLSS